MMWNALQPVYEPVITSGGLPVHSALVEHDGTGFLLAGVGGSGKTTCCERLPSGWRHLADDEALIVRTTDGALAVHPIPTWNSDKLKNGDGSWNISVSLPLGGIFLLEKSSRDEALSIGRGEAAARINESANQACRGRFHNLDSALRREWLSRLFDNACRISKDVPVYVLRVTRSGQFWAVIEDAMAHADETSSQIS
jgi:SynChlorMet cassette protein ScmC